MNSLIERDRARRVHFEVGVNPYADASVMAKFGETTVHITAFVEESVPSWMKGQQRGWVTAEYNMLPGSTHTRSRRERSKVSGRTQEIQRLIGRSLRSIVDLEALGERSIMIDCDVMIADGGTRTTSISGAYIALELACRKLLNKGLIEKMPLNEALAAVSIGITPAGKVIADLNYNEDSSCHTDMNFVMTESGKFIEIQGTAEESPFDRDQLNALIECAEAAMRDIFKSQKQVLDH